jgi:hypothetical protein
MSGDGDAFAFVFASRRVWGVVRLRHKLLNADVTVSVGAEVRRSGWKAEG